MTGRIPIAADLVANMILMDKVLVAQMIDVLHTVNLEIKTSVLEVEAHTILNQKTNRIIEKIPLAANLAVSIILMARVLVDQTIDVHRILNLEVKM